MKQINNKVILILLFSVAIALNSNANSIVVKDNTGFHSDNKPVLFLRDFFKWYKTKFDYLDHHVFYVAMDLKTNAPYRINLSETEKYLSVLQSSGFFSDNYILNYKSYFKKIDLTLQKTKQNDGTVDGLDYDLIMHNQEPESILKNLNNIRLSVLKSTTSYVTVKMTTPFDRDTYQLFYLKNSEGRYLIDKIEFYIGGKVQE